MKKTLVAFHGFTLNGALMHRQMGSVANALLPDVEVVCPDAPHVCSPETVAKFYERGGFARVGPPHLSWWNATEQGRVYTGWDATRELVRKLLEENSCAGILGFSQGAMLAAAVTALSEAGHLPRVPYVVLVAGATPRADVLRPFFETTLTTPSLHVWGERDELMGEACTLLVERFSPETREVAIWPGRHALPHRGAVLDSIADFVRRHA